MKFRTKARTHGRLMAFSACTAVAAGLTGGMAEPVSAQSLPLATRPQTFEFDLPAQLLGKAIGKLASQANLQVLYSDSEPANIEAPAVKGRMTAEEALSRLLVGSGYTYRYVRPGIITLRPVNSEGKETGARVLDPVRVEGASGQAMVVNGSTDTTATEGTRSYTTSAISIGTKSPESIKDTPQTVSVITRQRMDDQNLTSLSDVLNQAAGITMLGGGTNPLTPYSRAFEVTRVQVDGSAPVSIGATYSYQNLFEMAQYDHVEVLRGADGLFSGYGDPGATINLVRKRPLSHVQLSTEASAGSWNKYRLVGDATGPIGFDGRLRARFIATYQDQDYFFDVAESTLETQSLTFEADLSPNTLLGIGGSAMKRDSIPLMTGWPRYLDGTDLHLPRDLCACVDWGYFDTESSEVFLRAEQRLGERWSLDLKGTWTDQQTKLKYAALYGAIGTQTGGGTSLSAQREFYSSKQFVADATLNGEFELFGERQRLTVGANYQDVDAGEYELYVFTGESGISIPDIFSFEPTDFPEPLSDYRRSLYPAMGQKQWGAYARLNLTLWDRWHFPLGVRWSGYEYEQVQQSYSSSGVPRAPTVYLWRRNEFEPSQFAVIYDITSSLSVYGSYASINRGQADQLTASGEPLAPVTGDNLELGLKAQSADGRFTATFDFYRLEQKNFGISDLSVPRVNYGNGRTCCYIADPNRSMLSQGVDLEVAGQVLPMLELQASYTFNQNSQEGSSFGEIEGTSFQSQTPKHLLKVWSTLRPSGAWRRLELSLGINAQTATYVAGTTCTPDVPNPVTGRQACVPGTSVDYSFTEPARAIVSSAARYHLTDRWLVALNIENVADRRYYQTVGTTVGNNRYGTPRSFELAIKGSF
jgi:TonB-dependent siderophore receptor